MFLKNKERMVRRKLETQVKVVEMFIQEGGVTEAVEVSCIIV